MMTFTSTDPTTATPFASTPEAPPSAVAAALDLAAATQATWSRVSPPDRAQLLTQVARLLEHEEQDLAALMTREMGKPFVQALGEVRKCAWTARHFADAGPAMLADTPVATEASRAFVRYRPLGTTLAIMPWNFPLWQVFRFAIPALLAGNTVLFKHAPSTMECGKRIAALFRKAGAPSGLVQHLPLSEAAVASLIADPRIAAVTLTGSTRAGRAIAAIASQHLKPCVLELGGSDPFVVMPSANLDTAARVVVQSRIGNNGQSCIAAKRLIAHASIADALEARVCDHMRALRVGDPMDEAVDLGPLASAAARDHLTLQVQQTLDAGARLLLGGSPLRGPGFFFPPTVLADVPLDSPAARDELFGPVLPIFRVPSFDAALTLANATSFGLCASIWTNDPDEIALATTAIAAGGIFINAMSRSDPRLPFGGIRDSGFGRELGRPGLHSFCNITTVWID